MPFYARIHKRFTVSALALLVALTISGCMGTRNYIRESNHYQDIKPGSVLSKIDISPGLEQRILVLDPENISEQDVREILAKAPAPRIINIHGGVYPAYLLMENFSHFLMGMGYPEGKLRNPSNGTFSYGCHQPASNIAGAIAWFYEKEGLRPMLIGHSQGGVQTVKALHVLNGTFKGRLRPWNPLKQRFEDRYSILDPLWGKYRPAMSVTVPYASATGAGGLIRLLPQQWKMNGKLRKIPDSVEEFTGFYMAGDILGGDWVGGSDKNRYHATGSAKIRNVQLPKSYEHITVLQTEHLIQDQEIMDWINAYIPSEEPMLHREFRSSSRNILWAADIWHNIKKYWVLELQRVILAKARMNKIEFRQPEASWIRTPEAWLPNPTVRHDKKLLN